MFSLDRQEDVAKLKTGRRAGGDRMAFVRLKLMTHPIPYALCACVLFTNTGARWVRGIIDAILQIEFISTVFCNSRGLRAST